MIASPIVYELNCWGTIATPYIYITGRMSKLQIFGLLLTQLTLQLMSANQFSSLSAEQLSSLAAAIASSFGMYCLLYVPVHPTRDSYRKGPALIGSWITVALYGAACAQASPIAYPDSNIIVLPVPQGYSYYLEYHKDPLWMKLFVLWLWYDLYIPMLDESPVHIMPRL